MGTRETAEIEASVGRLLDAGDFEGAAVETLKGYGPEVLGYLLAILRDEDAAKEVFS
jgi:RNA polymerase sigma-70 factor (ECF subfamily)